jgi:hypothetical protein
MSRSASELAIPTAVLSCLAAICSFQNYLPRCDRCGSRNVGPEYRRDEACSLYRCQECRCPVRYDDGDFAYEDAIIAYMKSDAQAFPALSRPTVRRNPPSDLASARLSGVRVAGR